MNERVKKRDRDLDLVLMENSIMVDVFTRQLPNPFNGVIWPFYRKSGVVLAIG